MIPANIPLGIAEVIILVTLLEVDLGYKRPATLYLAMMEFIILLLMVEVELGINIPSTLPLSILEKDLMFNREVYICLRTATLPPMTQATVTDF